MQGVTLTDRDRSELVEKIQQATRGMGLQEIAWTAEAWEFMAYDLRRVSSTRPQQPLEPLNPS